MKAEDYLNSKDIYNHPRLVTRKGDNSLDVAELMEGFANAKLQEAADKIERQKLKSDREPSKAFNVGCDNSITLIKSLQIKDQ